MNATDDLDVSAPTLYTTSPAFRPIPQVVVERKGGVSRLLAGYAQAKIGKVIEHATEPVLFARLRLTMLADPALTRQAIAQVNLDLNGRPVRAQVAAETMREAVDLLRDRLRDRLHRVGRHWEARRGGMPQSHEWRHGSEPTHRPEYYLRPADERETVRHKSFAVAGQTVDDAAADLEALDYDFYLFVDSTTGRDAVIYRTHGGNRLVGLEAAPCLGTQEAIERLELSGSLFVFFADRATGRGNVAYHRYDGHYGLLTPAS
jgi:ribosome-associated translation inhibitor RaiA